MRIIIILSLLAAGCSSQLKYKYSFSKKYLGSLTNEDVEVSRVAISLRDPKIFASGMDSTFIHIKLYDKDGNQFTDVDPTDLTISTSEDIKAKPFAIKQGIYKSEILPKLRSKDIKMQVDWNERVYSTVVKLDTTIAPLKLKLKPVRNEFEETHYHGEIGVKKGSGAPSNSTEAFSLTNLISSNSYRNFSFEYLEQAKQNLSMGVDDAPDGTISHTMHSVFMVFPRKNMPLVEQLSGTIEVTIPTGEKIIFNKETKAIIGGVFSEGAVKRGRSRSNRHFADLKYKGKGVIIRANARGQSPEIGQYGKSKIDLEYGIKGSVDVLIINGTTGQRCRRPKSDFWEPIDVNPIIFKFATDSKLEKYLKAHCGFGLPKL